MEKEVPTSRLFNRRRYVFYNDYQSKREAGAEAKRRRKLGYRVRVVTFPNIKGHFLYERGLRTKF